MADNERRQYQRVPFIADVLLSHNEQQWSCGLVDVSLKGMLIAAPQGFDPVLGDVYVIKLVLERGPRLLFRRILATLLSLTGECSG